MEKKSLGHYITDWVSHSNKMERIWLMAKIEFKLRYYENKLGLLWALMKPVSDMLVYYIAFEVIMKSGIDNFVTYLFLGLIIWNFFLESTSGAINILQTKKYLYEYTNMEKLEIYISVLASNFVGFLFNFAIFTLIYFFTASGFDYHFIFIIPLLLNLCILSLGGALILSNLYILAKDISQVWTIIASIGFWLSPVIFQLSVYRSSLPHFDYLNPIAGIIINARNVIMYNKMPEWGLLGFDFVYALLFLLIGLSLLKNLGSRASENL